MQRGGTLSSSLHPGPPVCPEPWDSFRLGYEGARRVERGGYEWPPAEPVPRCVRPPPGFEGAEPAEGGCYGRPSIAGKYQLFLSEPHPRAGTAPGESTPRSVPQVQTEKRNRKEAEDPPVKRRISKPASQGQGKKRAKRPAEIKSPTERTDQTPRKRNAEITERREQEAELEQHAPPPPPPPTPPPPTPPPAPTPTPQRKEKRKEKKKKELTLAALTFTREQ